MGSIVAAEYVSLDGVMQDPGPTGDFVHRGWTVPYWNDELYQHQAELFFASDALLLGRVTYQGFAEAWQPRSGDPFTDRMNSMPKYVASRTLREPLEWNASLLRGDAAAAARKLKELGKKLLIYGSADLVGSLMRQGLIDRYRLMLYPVVLGSGKRLFQAQEQMATLSLTSVVATQTGVAVLTYEGS